MDVQRSTSEAQKLAKEIKAKRQPLRKILITHGHPDHYIGMDLLLKEFPEAKIVVANQDIKNWKEQLGLFKATYGDRNPTIYPGHGDPTNISLFAIMIEYIENFQRVTEKADSKEKAMSEMKKLYPDYMEADFLLKYSVDFHMEK